MSSFREETQSSRSQVPLLGDLPYAGVLFRNTLDDTRREEVIILITPRIIKHAQDEAVGGRVDVRELVHHADHRVGERECYGIIQTNFFGVFVPSTY